MTRRRERSAAPTGSRRAAREFAFRALFESERGELPLEQVFMRTAAQMHEGDETLTPLTPDAIAFARSLAEGLDMHWDEVQAALQRTIRGWSFEQMAQTDLNVLRLAAFEMMFTPEPHPPVIESAVRIARKFGGEDSGRFVNGVLGTLSRSLEGQPLPSAGADVGGSTVASTSDTAPDSASPAEQD